MEAFNALYDKSDSAIVDGCFTAFLSLYSNHTAFIADPSRPPVSGAVSRAVKKKFVDSLVESFGLENGVWKSWTDEGGWSSRSPENEGSSNLVVFQDNPHSHEALKCLANCIFLDLELKRVIVDNGGMANIVEFMKRSDLSLDAQFLFNRIMFLITVRNEAIADRLMREFNFGIVLLQNFEPIVKAMMKDEKPATDPQTIHNRAGTAFTNISTMTPTMVANEILKILFNLTIAAAPNAVGGGLFGAGGNEGTNEEARVRITEPCKGFIPLVISLLTQTPAPNPVLSPPYSHAVHALMNFPLSLSWRQQLWFPQGDYAIVNRLLDLLEQTVKAAFPPKNQNGDKKSQDIDEGPEPRIGGVLLDEALPPLMLLLCSIGRDDKPARAIIRKRLMPEDIDRSKPLDKGDTIGARMIGFMTSITLINVRQTASELLLVCCDEDANKLVSYVGYGNAVGYLFSRGIFPSQGLGAEGASSSATLTNESPASTGPMMMERPDIDPITGEYKRRQGARKSGEGADGAAGDSDDDDPLANMTEEEKEREAEKLFDLIQKLNKTGVIRAVTAEEAEQMKAAASGSGSSS
ncbi:hypothetical protein HK102_004283 [Quaeritorhiza haematococci]|nr:hypothetical protein HK102_004283 [Quaeritorhiza haematococci]